MTPEVARFIASGLKHLAEREAKLLAVLASYGVTDLDDATQKCKKRA